LCQTIGRGQPAYDSKQKIGHSILGDASRRLSVFHAVAKYSSRKTFTAADTSTPPEEWPLSLPATQHALVASNLAAEPIPAGADADPERFIAQSLMSSISAALKNPTMLTNTEWYKSCEFSGDQSVAIDDDVPLSLRSARLFVLAVSRLPNAEQSDFLNKFVESVSCAISHIKSSAANRTLIEEDADVSGFLARVVTVCATLVNVVTVGSRLRDALAAQVGPSHHGIPSFFSSQEVAPQKRQEDGNWYRSETSFMGLFSDWESPVVPSVTGPLQLRYLISDETMENLRVLHESAIQLGFLSAKHDRCHLLFSAWNASGRSASWESSPETVLRTETSAVDEGSATRLLLDIRNDICVMHREMNGNDGLFPNSLLTKFLTARGDGRRPGQLKVKLESMMSKAETIVESIFATSSSGKETDDPPVVSLALLEALSAYVAFIVAAHTRSIDNSMSSNPQREGGSGVLELSEEDSASSADDYHGGTEDDRVETLIRLNEACETFGAAPMHPDWLDVGCFLRDGVTAEDATKIAHRALACLERLHLRARAARMKLLAQGIELLLEGDSNCEQRADLALRLCLSGLDKTEAQGSSGAEALENAERLIDEIALLCGLEAWKVKMFSQNVGCKNSSHVTETFCQNAVQRILGGLHIRNNSFEDWEPSLSEYRACGEWELLLSEAMLGSCADMVFPEELSKSQQSLDVRRRCILAARWLRVQEACISHLMPVAALLRFGLSGGLGRNRHPLMSRVTAVADESEGDATASLDFCETLPASSSHTNSKALDDVARTLATLAGSTGHAEFLKRPCAAVASNLMIDSKAFMHLESMEGLRDIFEKIRKVRTLLGELGAASGTRTLSVSYLLDRLIRLVEGHGKLRITVDWESSRLGGLFSFLGGRPLSFDTITKSSVDHIAVVSTSLQDSRTWQQVQEQSIVEIIGLLSLEEWDVTVETWSRVSGILGSLARLEQEYTPPIGQQKGSVRLFPRIIKVLNGKGDSYFSTLAQWIICNPPLDPRPDESSLQEISRDLSYFVTFAVGAACSNSRKQSDDFKGGRIVLEALMQSMDQWLWQKSPVSNDVMSLLCLLGARHNALHTIGSRLLTIMTTRTESEERECAEPVERFFRFLRDLESALYCSNEANKGSSHARRNKVSFN